MDVHAQPALTLVSRILGEPINFRKPLASDLEPLKVSQSCETCTHRLLVVTCRPWNRDLCGGQRWPRRKCPSLRYSPTI